ncbi:biofilm development regulator YmgB/AriR family protein [Pseudescherichia sp.]|uniref:biofilm development regulator YmgB/AriR family protein n=1 Tax=Pseudescherichia sp. TaxID=2055881 RepID=UPI0028A2144B|nr:biofilm development regulator YmgB/AriR family protein [Pseudescherichia sp.]
MNKITHGNYVGMTTCQILVEAEHSASAIVLQPEYASPEEAIGAISVELLKSGKSLTFKEIQLVLIVRMKLSSGEAQQTILREALMLVTNKSLF